MIRRLGPEESELLRSVRLRALADAPTAFGSTHEREHAFTEEEWRGRLTPEGNPTFVWEADGDVGGMVVAAPDSEDPTMAYLLGMWVRDDRRGTGASDALVREVLRWAADRGVSAIRLHVTEGNAAAEWLYHRHGFERTGNSFERQRDRCTEIEMERRLRG